MSKAKIFFKRIPILLGPLVALVISNLPAPDPAYPNIMLMAGVTCWIALWWLTEVIHLAVTSLLPFLLLPILGICDFKVVAAQYMDPILFLFIGGFFMAFAIEGSGLHKRIALKILSITGKSPSSLLFGLMFTAYFISMWISNTATVMMLLAAVFAVITHLKPHIKFETHYNELACTLLVGLAYAANIGGMATLVGTPTNMIFYRAYTEAYPLATNMNFFTWFQVGLPISFLLFISAWFIVRTHFGKDNLKQTFSPTIFKEEYLSLGKITTDEKRVGILFLFAAVLWFTRSNIEFGSFQFYGWCNLFPYPDQLQDSSVAIAIAVLLFLIPSKNKPTRRLLEWDDASRLPYDIILLFGSGFALAKGFDESGLSKWLALKLFFLNDYHPILILFVVCLMVTIISEFASNVASIQLVLPILIALQQATQLSPLLLLVPATLAASLGFMLPIATAPNTIVFSSGKIKVKEMAKFGFFTNLAGIFLITVICYLVYK